MAKGYQGPAEILQRYDDLIAANPTIKRSGASMPYTSVNGHMFSFLDPSGRMSLRLSPDDRTVFMDRYDTVLSEQHGRVMKEYVVVPDALLQQVGDLSDWLMRSHRWVSGLKPKATTRP